jgi:putative molybdopterin biosynthesis protein
MKAAQVYDSNGQALCDAVRELGGAPRMLGIVPDRLDALRERLLRALDSADLVLLSGGTSKGDGDLCYQVVRELTQPGIVAHGVALKPGKPICLASHHGKPVVVLPGFPTSAIFTFHEFVAPVLRLMAGRLEEEPTTIRARLGVKINSEIGRTEYMLVHVIAGRIVTDQDPPRSSSLPLAYPLGKGSGSVTTFSAADGFVTIGRHQEIVEAGTVVAVHRIGRSTQPADLVIMGSHCVGLDYLIGRLREAGLHAKAVFVGSSAGLAAAERGECDVAGIHLFDAGTGRYNRPFVTAALQFIPGYGRRQGIVFRGGDPRFTGETGPQIVARIAGDSSIVMVNRNQGSGTRILIDRLLEGNRPPGYAVQPTNHTAVAAAVAQGRADWGIAIEWVARSRGLGFIPLADEQYDFVVPRSRMRCRAVEVFCRLLVDPQTGEALRGYGFCPNRMASDDATFCELPEA